MEQKIQANVIDEKEVIADEVTIMHNPSRFFLDFKTLSPRNDFGGPNRLILRHNIVIIDPFLAKELHRVLDENIKNYEKKFGQIKKPEAIIKAEKMLEKEGKKDKKPETYFG